MPTPTQNVLFPFVLPPTALRAADRLIAALMTFIDALADIAAIHAPTVRGHAAQTLFFRLSGLIVTLVRISTFGIRAPREPKPATPVRLHSAPPEPPVRPATPRLPRRPGWLLAALPDIAPAVAADLGIILADPAFAALLDAAPSLHRTLRPLLRALGLTATPYPNAPLPNAPLPKAPSPRARLTAPHPSAHKAKPRISKPSSRNCVFQTMPLHVLIVT